MVVDAVLVAAKAVAGAEKRRMPVGDPCQLVEPPAGKHPEAIEMRLEGPEIFTRQIERQQIAQAPIDRIKIEPRAIRREPGRSAIEGAGERLVAGNRVHARSS